MGTFNSLEEARELFMTELETLRAEDSQELALFRLMIRKREINDLRIL